MSDTQVVTENRDGIAVITVNRPKKLNALDRAVLAQLAAAIEAAAADEGVAALVITGAGEKAFVAGADIAEMAAMSPEEARRFSAEGQVVAEAIDGAGKPVIAAVNGYALGGGCELALACHLRLASPKAIFGQPEVGLGLIPGFGGTQRLPRLVGEGKALEMILTGRPIDAQEAHRIGLVNGVIEEGDLVDAAVEMGRLMAKQGPVALRLALDAVRTGLSMSLAEGLRLEGALFGLCFSTEDMKAGTKAFLERRKPAFRGA